MESRKAEGPVVRAQWRGSETENWALIVVGSLTHVSSGAENYLVTDLLRLTIKISCEVLYSSLLANLEEQKDQKRRWEP